MEHWIQAEGRFCGQGYDGNVSKAIKTVIRPKLRMFADDANNIGVLI